MSLPEMSPQLSPVSSASSGWSESASTVIVPKRKQCELPQQHLKKVKLETGGENQNSLDHGRERLRGTTFHLLTNPQLSSDIGTKVGLEYVIKACGGTIESNLDNVTKETVGIASSDNNLNRQMFEKIENIIYPLGVYEFLDNVKYTGITKFHVELLSDFLYLPDGIEEGISPSQDGTDNESENGSAIAMVETLTGKIAHIGKEGQEDQVAKGTENILNEDIVANEEKVVNVAVNEIEDEDGKRELTARTGENALEFGSKCVWHVENLNLSFSERLAQEISRSQDDSDSDIDLHFYEKMKTRYEVLFQQKAPPDFKEKLAALAPALEGDYYSYSDHELDEEAEEEYPHLYLLDLPLYLTIEKEETDA